MKWIVVTGDTGGLGRNIIEEILTIEEYCVIGISRKQNRFSQYMQQQFPQRYVHLNFDFCMPDKIRELYHKEIRAIHPIYGLVNNSAIAYDDIVTNADLNQLDQMYKVNVLSPIILSKFIIRDMILNDTPGSIVHITSVSSATGFKGLSMYASTKGALESFSKGIAREWGAKGIRSNCVSPGFMETSMSSGIPDEIKNKIYNRTSLKSAVDMKSVASAVVFLLSSHSVSITGTTIHVDNGAL